MSSSKSMLSLERLWRDRNRTPVLAISGTIILLIALADWWTKPYVSLGFLYLFPIDRKSTRLNSSHLGISYAVFCLKKKPGDLPSPDFSVPSCHFTWPSVRQGRA